jgi:glycine cleavage system H protein
MNDSFLETTVDKFVFRVKVGYYYHDAGIWAAWDADRGVVRLGLSDYTQQTGGDVAFIRLPEPGKVVQTGEELATVETVKVDLEIPAPFDGQIVAVNEALQETPELINQDPYGRGWLVEMRPTQWPVPNLLDAAQYLRIMTAQAQAEVNR